MNALAILICVGSLGVILYIVGGELIRDVFEDFFARSDREANVRDELEACWLLPTREPRR